jgi:hypothetical protein
LSSLSRKYGITALETKRGEILEPLTKVEEEILLKPACSQLTFYDETKRVLGSSVNPDPGRKESDW